MFTKGHTNIVSPEARKRAGLKNSLRFKGRKFTAEQREHMRLAHLGKTGPHYGHRGLLSGDKNPSKRPEVRAKISQAKKGKKSPWTAARNRSNSGEKAASWRGGISRAPYPFIFNPELKAAIRARDNYTCQLCGITEVEQLKVSKRRLSVNHIDFNKNNCSEENLNALCNVCNSKINWNRDFYTQYFRSRTESKMGKPNPFDVYMKAKGLVR